MQRWAKFWERTVLALRIESDPLEPAGWRVAPTWRDEDIALVAEYVRRCRLSELHGIEAEATPYVTNLESGFVRPHGGWERSLAEAREARALAVELRLTPRARLAAGVDIPSVRLEGASAGDVGRDGETAWRNDQVGPDGEPL